jgi:dephospho-CoA kinase
MTIDATPLIIAGLTGGIASGKSTVAAMLAAAGARIVDADRIAHQVVDKGQPAYDDIVRHFGPAILKPDGQIDREALGDIVFNDKDAKQALNDIVHPRVNGVMQQYIHQLAREHPQDPVILDIPLLIESGWHTVLPVVILVYVPEVVQQTRLMTRDGLTATDAMARIRAQMPIDAKRAHADYIIDNTGTLEDTQRQVLAVYEKICAGGPPSAASGDATQP